MACWRSSSSLMTVGEANEGDLSRSYLWKEAVLLPLCFLALAMAVACVTYIIDTDQIAREPWLLLVVVAWLPCVTLGQVITSYVNLYLPLAPVAVENALFVITWVGFVLMMAMASLVLLCGHAMAFGCTVAVAVAGLLALWLWLHRTYHRAVDSQLLPT